VESGAQADSRHIMVADDHPLFREGVSALLADLHPAARIWQAGTFAELLEQARSAGRPEMFVLDLWFPGMDLLHAIPRLRGEFPQSAIAIVSMADDRATIERVLSAGVDGFISKAVNRDQMRAAFASLHNGDFIAVGGTDAMIPGETLTNRFPDLTRRQRDVLRYVCEGKSNKEIARMLEISPYTVRVHVSSLLRALRVETRAALVAVSSRGLG
jgi:DNA-binding NarL/FixJ family response regulator